MPSALDDPFYYLNNFSTVLDWIGSRYDDLLLDEERTFLATFAGLPREAQALLVRMVMRKGERFRESKLVYAEIGPTRETVRPLLALGWVDAAPALDLEQLFALLRKPEIAACFGAQLGRGDARKAEQLARLQPLYPEPRPFDAWCPTLDDRVYALHLMPLCDRLRLMFFGNLTQDWSEFVLADLGIHQYEQVALEADARGFRHRDDVDLYLRLHQCRERLEAGDACPATLLADIPRPTTTPGCKAGARGCCSSSASTANALASWTWPWPSTATAPGPAHASASCGYWSAWRPSSRPTHSPWP